MEAVTTITKYDEELSKIYGLGEAKETIQYYLKYIQLRQQGMIKDIGNYNLFIKVSENYSQTNKILKLIKRALSENGIVDSDYYEVTQKEITTKLSKIENDLILLADKVNFNMFSTLDILPQYIKHNSKKIFIVVYTPTIPKKPPKLSPIEEVTKGLFFWELELTGVYSAEEKQRYITETLKSNKIKINSSTLVSNLANQDIGKIDKELLYLVVKCKANHTNTITDKFLKQIHRMQYIKQDTHKTLVKLDNIIGQEKVIKEIHDIVNYIKLCKSRNSPLPSLHFVFKGNPRCL